MHSDGIWNPHNTVFMLGRGALASPRAPMVAAAQPRRFSLSLGNESCFFCLRAAVIPEASGHRLHPGAAPGLNTRETNQIIPSGKQAGERAAIAGPAAAPLHALALSTGSALDAVARSSGCNYSTSDMEIPMTRCSGEAAPPSSETNGLILEPGCRLHGDCLRRLSDSKLTDSV